MTEIHANWNYPTVIRAGAGRIEELPDLCHELGIIRPLLVTDPGLAALPLLAGIITTLEAEQLSPKVFSDIQGNPRQAQIEAGVNFCRGGGFDGIIAIGGGSALDAGKAIGLMAGQTRPLWDFEDKDDNYRRVNVDAMLPVIAVPTTAGTGSEVGRAAVITDDDSKCKRLIFHPKMMPVRVILDPGLTTGLSAGLTAATGMDALSHNLEAFCAPGFHPIADGIAVEGIRLVYSHLVTAVKEPDNLEARLGMLTASTMGAMAFQKGLGAMHALAHPLGARYDAHHGTLNAILMPYVLRHNEVAIMDKLSYLARALDLTDHSADAFIDWILRLRSTLGIPHSLTALGIDETVLDTIGEEAWADPSAATNPTALTPAQYREITRRALLGLV
jgi:alcohol dehydrogenase class IV